MKADNDPRKLVLAMLFVLAAVVVLAVAGLFGWTADSRSYGNWSADTRAPRPRT